MNASSTVAAPRSVEVHDIVESVTRYNPENIPVLEQHVEEQVAGRQLPDLEANLALIKLYQFNPSELNVRVVALCLALAMSCPTLGTSGGADVNLILYMLPHALLEGMVTGGQQDDTNPAIIPALVSLHSLLASAQYQAFWAAWTNPSAAGVATTILTEFPDFAAHIRVLIAASVERTFKTMSVTTFGELVNLKPVATVTSWIASHMPGWKVEGAGKASRIIFPAVVVERAEREVIKPTIAFEAVRAIF